MDLNSNVFIGIFDTYCVHLLTKFFSGLLLIVALTFFDCDDQLALNEALIC